MSQAGPVNILNGVDLKIAKGEAIGLVGPSGSGKSTMLMVMAGLERPTSGKVTVAGQELSRFDEDAAARFRRGNVGIVFQSFHLIPTMTALENVAVPLELAMVANAFDRALEELKAVGLAHRVDHYPSQLSGGEQQRVALARAIAPRPGILFADEPTGNLDGRTGAEIMDLMFVLQRERGATLVLVTHDEDLVKRCDRIVRLRDGRIDGIETVGYSAAPIFMPAAPHQVAAIVRPAPPVVAPLPLVEPEPEPAQSVAEPVELPEARPEPVAALAIEPAQSVAPQEPEPEPAPQEPEAMAQEPEVALQAPEVAPAAPAEISPELEPASAEAAMAMETVGAIETIEPQVPAVEVFESTPDPISIAESVVEEPAAVVAATEASPEALPAAAVEAVAAPEAVPLQVQIREAEIHEPAAGATPIAEPASVEPAVAAPGTEGLLEPEFRRVAAGGE